MKSNYRPLGNYIRELNERNSDLSIKKLLGVSMEKTFIPSVANLNGVDMSVYKVLRNEQLACKLMSVGRDEKLPVDLYKDNQPALVSSAYYVFEPKDKEVLLPEYLMMWLCRPENDRYIGFISGGDVRGGISWETFCSLPIKVPSISKQREIVKEYNVIQNRISLNQQMIQKLEETAQAIYKQWFVDFEFPDEKGKSYKSNGGEMEESELGEIPLGWEVKKISSLCQITSSKRVFESEYTKVGIPFYRAGEIKQKKEGVYIKELLYISEEKFKKIIKSFGHPLEGDILLTAVGSLLGDSYLVENETFYFKDGNVIWFRKFKLEALNLYLYEYLQSENFKDFLTEIKIGSGQSAITIQSLNEKLIIKPQDNVLSKYKQISLSINNEISLRKKQNSKLFELKELLLSKLATLEN